jgi:hypothetical protein
LYIIAVYIEFTSEFGDLPLLIPDTSLLSMIREDTWYSQANYYMNITEYQKGTKEDVECSRKGICNYDTGRCGCMEGFQSSNGTAYEVGERGDCTFFNPWYTEQAKYKGLKQHH